MSTNGESVFKGINFQALAALSLFLQYLRDSNFARIQLEGKKLEDFTLFFGDGKKIFCESKNRNAKFSYPHLKEVFNSILSRGQLEDGDEILIVCSNINDQFRSDVKNSKYFDELKNKFSKKGYSKKQISLLEKVKFWVISEKVNEDVVISLLTELINFWLPPEDVQKLADNILVQKIYKGSAKGNVYTREDFFAEIEELKISVLKQGDRYNLEVTKREDQFKNLERIVSKGVRLPAWGTASISTFTLRWDLMSFAVDRLKTRTDLELSNWETLWKFNRVYYFTFGIFAIFKNNINSVSNRKYIVEYIKKYTKTIRGFYRSDYFATDVVKILDEILLENDGSAYLDDSFSIIQDLLTNDADDFFYLKGIGSGSDEWERNQISSLLLNVYNKAGAKLRKKIVDFILESINITEDDGEFNWHAPKDVYSILRSWLSEDFENRFKRIVSTITEQYERYYEKYGSAVVFSGWEFAGGGTSYMNGNYHTGDRHFVSSILTPAIENFYKENPNAGWSFIKKNCIFKVDEVSRDHPDFLNRSVYEIVLRRYASTDLSVSEEAFLILKEFILSRRGIPHKADLIYQSLNSIGLDTTKVWRLIQLTTDKYEVPVNPYSETIVTKTAKDGNLEAKNLLRKWFKNEKYFKQITFDLDAVSTIKSMLDSDFELAIELYQSLLESSYIKGNEKKNFGAYNVSDVLHQILTRDYDKGLSIVRSIEAEKKPTISQQIILSCGIYNHTGNDDSDDEALLDRIYSDVIDPLLTRFDNDAKKISEWMTHSNSRDVIVQFASRLASKKKIEKSIRIISVFVNDPDPYLPNEDPEDPKNEYNEHKRVQEGQEPHAITSVRGWCAWVLMKCSVLDGRPYIPQLVKLLETLLKDENYYVLHMATFSLKQMGANRLTVLPSNRDVLYLNDDKVEALKLSKHIETLAFALVENLTQWPRLVQKAMAESVLQALDPIRALNEKDALRLVNAFAKLPPESLAYSAPYLIYFAEIRQDDYKSWKFQAPGLYDDLDEYDGNKFKELLIDVIRKVQKEDPEAGFKFGASVEHAMRTAIESGENQKKFTELALRYFDVLTDTYSHSIYSLVCQVIEGKMNTVDEYTAKWLALYHKCLTEESEYYKGLHNVDPTKRPFTYSSLYHSKILESVYKISGKEVFLEEAKLYFAFPDTMELHESTTLVDIIEELAPNNTVAKQILDDLIKKNPSKYWDRGKKKKRKKPGNEKT